MMKSKNFNLNSDIADTPIIVKAKSILINNGILTLDHLTNLTKKELKAIKGLGQVGFYSILLFLKETGLVLKKEIKVKDDLIDFKKKLVFKFLKNPQEANWANEIKAATLLLKNNPNLEFWEKFTLPFKLNSLFFLVSQKGKEFIFEAQKNKNQIKTFQKKSVKLESDKLGDDIVTSKPKSVKDFLNGK